MNDDTPGHAASESSEYQHLIERFDRLWESATSPHQQREMRRLLARIRRYEAPQHDADSRQQSI